jgi:hypothetical protein
MELARETAAIRTRNYWMLSLINEGLNPSNKPSFTSDSVDGFQQKVGGVSPLPVTAEKRAFAVTAQGLGS